MTEALLDRLHTPVLTLDRSGRIRSANAAFAALVGGSHEGTALADLFTGIEWALVHERSAEQPCTCTLGRGGRLFSTTVSALDADQRLAEVVVHSDESDYPDLIQTRRMIAALQHSGEAIVITDRDARIVYVNPEFERTMGFTREEVLGGHVRLWRSDVHDETMYETAWERLQRGETWRGELVNRRGDGTLIHVDTTISRVASPNGEVLGYVEVKRDMTRQRELEQSLAHVQRMESIGTLAGGVAHDYNNVLQTILGNAELIVDGPGDAKQTTLMAEEIRVAAEQSASLTSQLLTFARRQIASPQVLDTNAEIARTTNMLRRLVGASIELRWRPDPDLWPVRLDPSQLGQIVTNVCINARDAIEGVGTIEVFTRNVRAADCAALPVPTEAHRDLICIEVRDDGCGMEPAVAERIFEPFFTSKPVGEGTGLGLATVWGIVLQNGGHVFVDSEPGVGTTMNVYLPRHEGERRDDPAPRAGVEAPKRRPKVLVLEDEAAILKLVDRFLTAAGYAVSGHTDPQAGIRAAREMDDLELVIADVIMPGMNGRDAVNAIRALRPDVDALYVSGYTAEVLAELPDGERSEHFLRKPFTRAQLLERVGALLPREPRP